MFRFFALAVLLLSPAAIFALHSSSSSSKPAPAATVQGVVADPTGAIVPSAEVDLVDADGSIAGTTNPAATATSRWPRRTPATSRWSSPSRDSKPYIFPSRSAHVIRGAPAAHVLAAPLHIALPIAAVATNVRVNADTRRRPDRARRQSRLLGDDFERPEGAAHLRQRLRHRHERVPRRQRHRHRRHRA